LGRIAAFGTRDVAKALKAYSDVLTEAWGVATNLRSKMAEGTFPDDVFKFRNLTERLQQRLQEVEDLVRDDLAKT
jgi:ubiquinone biosynthesis protein UbiJ